MCSTGCSEWPHPAGSLLTPLLAQLRFTSLSRRLPGEEAIVVFGLFCITSVLHHGMMLCGGRQHPGLACNWEGRSDCSCRLWQSPKGGTAALTESPSVVAPASPEPLLPAHMGKLLYGKQQGQGTDWAWALPLCPSPCFLYCPTDLHCCMPTLWKTAKKKILLKFYVFNNSSTLNVAPAPELFYPYLFPWD